MITSILTGNQGEEWGNKPGADDRAALDMLSEGCPNDGLQDTDKPKEREHLIPLSEYIHDYMEVRGIAI